MKNDDSLFYKVTAVAAFLTAGTTFFLWLLPRLYAAPTTFEEGLALSKNSYYLARQWINLIHIPFALIAYFGFAYKLRKRALPSVSLGLIWFVMWAIIEMTGVSIIIFSVNKTWRDAYPSAPDDQQNVLRANIDAFYSMWDSMFFVLLIAFLLGTLFYGWAAVNGRGLEKMVGYLFLSAAPLTVCILLAGYANLSWAGVIVTWTYPVLQPVSRFVLGLYLWKEPDVVS